MPGDQILQLLHANTPATLALRESFVSAAVLAGIKYNDLKAFCPESHRNGTSQLAYEVIGFVGVIHTKLIPHDESQEIQILESRLATG